MDKIPSNNVAGLAKTQPIPPQKDPVKTAEPSPAVYSKDAVDAERLNEVATAAKAKPASLTESQLGEVAKKKATCPFIGSAVATQALPVRNTADRPLASIDDVVALGNSGGGNLGNLLKLFATGNHAKMLGTGTTLEAPVPAGLFSLDFPGSQGSHPGHSSILQGDPTQLNSGRFSPADFDRLLARAKDGYLKRSDIGKFIAENLVKDPHSKVLDTKVVGLLAGDLGRFGLQTGPALLENLKHHADGLGGTEKERKLVESLTKVLGEDNLVGSSGEFGLLMAFLAHSPRTKEIDGEPAITVDDLKAMFQEHRLPDGWETWPKTEHDWVINTTTLMADAGREYHHLKAAN